MLRFAAEISLLIVYLRRCVISSLAAFTPKGNEPYIFFGAVVSSTSVGFSVQLLSTKLSGYTFFLGGLV